MIVFKVGERVVGATRARSQRSIERVLSKLATQHLGSTVSVHYPCTWCGEQDDVHGLPRTDHEYMAP